MTNPYRGLPSEQFWNSAVADCAPGLFDPVPTPSFGIGRTDSIATLGSCFAQHVAASIRSSGYHYLVTEQAPEGSDDETRASYQVFSARYGNVYTVGQAVQLLQRACEGVEFPDDVWERDGRWFDAFRPTVEPGGFDSREALLDDRARHLAAVRRLFTEADVLVFTLGLTEGWRSRASGAIFPLAPGVAAGSFDPQLHEFVNDDYPAVRWGLHQWMGTVRTLNPDVRVILTVSPVPLMATYLPRNVWVSTAYSKATLLAAAQDCARDNEGVDYFPSYEVITSPLAAARYYEDDLRNVKPVGVQHVMRLFGQHYLEDGTAQREESASLVEEYIEAGRVICDEELLVRPDDGEG